MDTKQIVQQQSHIREIDKNHLDEKDLYQHDPVLRLLKGSLKLNSFWFITGSIVLIGLFIAAFTLTGIPFTQRRSLWAILNIFTTVLFFGSISNYLPILLNSSTL
jgi:hypothetical protein